MANTTLKISLPEELKDEAAILAKKQHFTMSGYVQHLFRQEVDEQRERRKLRSMLLEAMDSESQKMTLGELRERLLTRLDKKKN